LEELIEEYTEVLEKNKQCPVCYSPIDDECLKMVVENLKERYEG
jgi:hypothetical protein